MEVVEASIDEYVNLVLGAEGKKEGEKALLEKSRVDVVQYLLVLVGELCEGLTDIPPFCSLHHTQRKYQVTFYFEDDIVEVID